MIEIENLKRLTDSYKNYFEEATSKVQELEISLNSMRESHASKITKIKEQVKQQVEEYEKGFIEERNQLLNKITDLEEQLSQSAQQLASSNVNLIPDISINTLSTQLPSNFEDINITELYDRLVLLERELLQERNKRKETELYMNQILKDVENKAPLIAKQRRDYQRIVQSHHQLTEKIDRLTEENHYLKTNTKDSELKIAQLVKQQKLLEVHNADLSRQIQHILRVSMQAELGDNSMAILSEPSVVEESEGQGIISNHLIVYNNIEELQSRNEQLVQVIRKLCDEKEALEAQQFSNSTGSMNSLDLLKQATLELSELKESRTKSEEMVAVLIQQRDMYRSMIENDNTVTNNSLTLLTPNKSNILPSFSSPEPLALQQNLKENQQKIDQLEEEKRRIQDRLTRYEENEQSLRENIDKLRSEATSARIEATQSSSEARFQKERVDRLESSLKLSQQETSSALQRRIDLEKVFLDLQKELQSRDDHENNLQDQLRHAQERIKRFEIDLEVKKSSEERLLQQLVDAREEIKRHTNLTESLHRIESGLQTRAEEEKEKLSQENNLLKKSYDSMKKQINDQSAIDSQKIKVLEDDLRSVRARLDQKISESTSLSEALAREQGLLRAAQERAAIIERQLQITQESLQASKGIQLTDSLIEKELKEKDLAISKLENDNESLREQLQSTESHAEQYRKLSSSNEEALKAIRTKHQDDVSGLEQKVQDLTQELERVQNETSNQRQSTQGFLLEIEQLQDQLRNAEQKHNDEIHQLQSSLSQLTQLNSTYQQQIQALNQDITKLQQTCTATHDNYERELQLHAQAERDLREERLQVQSLRQDFLKAQDQISQLTSNSFNSERQVQEERKQHELEVNQYKEQLTTLQLTNDLLHSQVQSYGLQIQKLHEHRLASYGSFAVNPAPSTSEITEEERTNMEQKSDELTQQQLSYTNYEEIQELIKSSTEMREVLRYMKREKEMLQARLNIAETENNRYVNQLQSLTKSLDEVRQELKQQLQTQASVYNQEEYQRLLRDVNQLNIIRESNSHLRHENEELLRKILSLQETISKEQDKINPLEEKVRSLTAEKESLELVNDQLNNDVGYWRNRLHSLVSRYNEVDPEEHKMVKSKLEETTSLVQQLEAKLLESEAKLSESSSSSDKALDEAKTAKERAEKYTETLRDKLRVYNVRISELTKSQSTLQASNTSLENQLGESSKKIQSLEGQITDLNQKLSTAITAATLSQETPAVSTPAKTAGKKRERPSEIAPSQPQSIDTPANVEASTTSISASVPPLANNSKAPRLKQVLSKKTPAKETVPLSSAQEAPKTETATKTVTEVEPEEAPETKKAKIETPVAVSVSIPIASIPVEIPVVSQIENSEQPQAEFEGEAEVENDQEIDIPEQSDEMIVEQSENADQELIDTNEPGDNVEESLDNSQFAGEEESEAIDNESSNLIQEPELEQEQPTEASEPTVVNPFSSQGNQHQSFIFGSSTPVASFSSTQASAPSSFGSVFGSGSTSGFGGFGKFSTPATATQSEETKKPALSFLNPQTSNPFASTNTGFGTSSTSGTGSIFAAKSSTSSVFGNPSLFAKKASSDSTAVPSFSSSTSSLNPIANPFAPNNTSGPFTTINETEEGQVQESNEEEPTQEVEESQIDQNLEESSEPTNIAAVFPPVPSSSVQTLSIPPPPTTAPPTIQNQNTKVVSIEFFNSS